MSDLGRIGENFEMWAHLGFEPWEHAGMKGAARKITMVKSSILGPVATYYAWDYVVWTHQDERDAELVFREWQPLPDVVTQRFLFVTDRQCPADRKAKSFWMGLKGFLELYFYTPGAACHPKIKDLAPPIDLAWSGKLTSTEEFLN